MDKVIFAVVVDVANETAHSVRSFEGFSERDSDAQLNLTMTSESDRCLDYRVVVERDFDKQIVLDNHILSNQHDSNLGALLVRVIVRHSNLKRISILIILLTIPVT